ncbi:MAG: hypothetical protein EBY20_01380 [Alphaproteobacteria bacterium]|uniref:Uncharacterized protein n=1 Tax=viral metagenome TaxID=1070528 RepID=A0A6C0HPW0_9ZZZZ|nr:hypothetical protein [Alphaproteobacteria bacterium]
MEKNLEQNLEETNIDALVILRNILLRSRRDLRSDNKLVSRIENLNNIVEQRIKSECKHDYVEDYIDIDPERSQRICYCNKCYSCFPTN